MTVTTTRTLALTLVSALALVLTTSARAGDEPKLEKGRWIPLFNGKDLDGLDAEDQGLRAGDNYGDTFRVEDGVIKVRYDKYPATFDGRFGHLFYEEAVLELQPAGRVPLRRRPVPKGGPGWALRNSGVMIHGQTPETHARRTRSSPCRSRSSSSAATERGDRHDRQRLHAGHEHRHGRQALTPPLHQTRSPRPTTATSGSRARSRSTATARSSTSINGETVHRVREAPARPETDADAQEADRRPGQDAHAAATSRSSPRATRSSSARSRSCRSTTDTAGARRTACTIST